MSLGLSGDRDVLFRGRFRAPRERSDAEGTSPLKSQLFCQSRARIDAGDLFSDDRGVRAQLSHVGSRGSVCAMRAV